MSEWRIEHQERFAAAPALDAAYWRLETGFQRNREEQYYAPGNVAVEDGVLRIEARREERPNAAWLAGSGDWRRSRRVAQYTSSSLVSRQPLHFGRVEVVARTSGGAGVWPAIWLVHEAAGLYGEIDLFEYVGKHPQTVFAGVHWGRDARSRQHRNQWKKVEGLEGRWTTHTLEWTPAAIVAALDGAPWFRFDPDAARLPGGADPLRQPMHLRINLALGGSWGGRIDPQALPARFEIASIRTWRWMAAGLQAPAPAVAPAGPPPAAAPNFRWGR